LPHKSSIPGVGLSATSTPERTGKKSLLFALSLMVADSLHILSLLPAGSTAVVQEINLPSLVRTRLMELGLLVGTTIELVRLAPAGDPLEIKLRGYHLALPKHEADQIRVSLASPSAKCV
jgi:ferrous iron transport protein A